MTFVLTAGIVFIDIGNGQNLNFESLLATYDVTPIAIGCAIYSILGVVVLKIATWFIDRRAMQFSSVYFDEPRI